MTDKELINQITIALEKDETFSSALVSIILKDEKSRTLIQKIIAEEAVKQINLRFGRPELDKSPKKCPECDGRLIYNSYHSRFEHNDDSCIYAMDKYGDCVWNNAMRDEQLRKDNNQ